MTSTDQVTRYEWVQRIADYREGRITAVLLADEIWASVAAAEQRGRDAAARAVNDELDEWAPTDVELLQGGALGRDYVALWRAARGAADHAGSTAESLDALRNAAELAAEQRGADEALGSAAEQIEDGGLPGSAASGYYASYEVAGYGAAERDAVAWLKREQLRREEVVAPDGVALASEYQRGRRDALMQAALAMETEDGEPPDDWAEWLRARAGEVDK